MARRGNTVTMEQFARLVKLANKIESRDPVKLGKGVVKIPFPRKALK